MSPMLAAAKTAHSSMDVNVECKKVMSGASVATVGLPGELDALQYWSLRPLPSSAFPLLIVHTVDTCTSRQTSQ